MYDVLAPTLLALPDAEGDVTVEDAAVRDADEDGRLVTISGVSAINRRYARAARLGQLLWRDYLECHLRSLSADERTRDRAKALLVTGSYSEAKVVAQSLGAAIGRKADDRVRYLVRERSLDDDRRSLLPRELETFGHGDADILIAPLALVCRGHNILRRGGTTSAIASIFVLVRPVPPTESAARALAHVSYDAARRAQPSSCPADALSAARRRAEQQLRLVQENAAPFGYLPAELRHHVLCDVLVDLEQLVGRARRGGTDVRLYLVDGAFQGDRVGWRDLIAKVFSTWRAEGSLERMRLLHGVFLAALERYAGLNREG
jgi:hypothetical protein